ncbi:MAG: hypothetical protein FWC84_03470 [Alphaproteobacteria bacterium]|nr:hypothetical protein [Alphaproteobacteria bacterium]
MSTVSCRPTYFAYVASGQTGDAKFTVKGFVEGETDSAAADAALREAKEKLSRLIVGDYAIESVSLFRRSEDELELERRMSAPADAPHIS